MDRGPKELLASIGVVFPQLALLHFEGKLEFHALQISSLFTSFFADESAHAL